MEFSSHTLAGSQAPRRSMRAGGGRAARDRPSVGMVVAGATAAAVAAAARDAVVAAAAAVASPGPDTEAAAAQAAEVAEVAAAAAAAAAARQAGAAGGAVAGARSAGTRGGARGMRRAPRGGVTDTPAGLLAQCRRLCAALRGDLDECIEGSAVMLHVSEIPGGLAAIRAAGGAQALVGALVAHGGDLHVADWALMTLGRMAGTEEGAVAVLAAGGAGAVVGALAAHASNAGLAMHACGVLAHSAYSAAGAAAVQAAGGVGVALAVLRRHRGNAETSAAACMLLAQMARAEGGVAAVEAAGGATEALTFALATHGGGDAFLSEWGSLALERLAHSGSEAAGAVVAAGGVAALVGALAAHGRDHARVAAFACIALESLTHTDAGVAAAMAAGGAVKALVVALKAHHGVVGNVPVETFVCGVLARMCRYAECADELVEAGGVRAILMSLAGGDAEAITSARSALTSVMGHPGSADVVPMVAYGLEVMLESRDRIRTAGVANAAEIAQDLERAAFGVTVGVLVYALDCHRGNTSACADACRALLSVARSGARGTAVIVAAGGVAELRDARDRSAVGSEVHALASAVLAAVEPAAAAPTARTHTRAHQRYVNAAVQAGDAACPICRDMLALGADVALLPCDHVVCHAELLAWAAVRETCPECRAPFTLAAVERYTAQSAAGAAAGAGQE